MDGYGVLKRAASFRNYAKRTGHAVYHLDLGRTDVNYHPKYQRSKLGIFVSIFVIVVVAFFVVFTTGQFSKGVPAIIYNANIPSQYEEMKTPMVGIGVSFSNGTYFSDPNYFTVKYSQVTITNHDSVPRVKVGLNSTTCTFYQNPPSGMPSGYVPPIYTSAAICPEKPITMKGSYEMDVYQYLDIAINRCQCPPLPANCTCVSDAEFNAVFFKDTNINLIVQERNPSYSIFANKFSVVPSADFSQPPVPRNFTNGMFWYTSRLHIQKVDVTIQKKTIYIGPRFIFDYNVETFYTVGGTVARTADYMPQPTNVTNNLFKAYIRLDDYDNQEYRQSPPLLQLVGSWGALWTFFSLTLLQLVQIYNYKKHEREKSIDKMVTDLVLGSPTKGHDGKPMSDPNNNNNNNSGSSLGALDSNNNFYNSSGVSIMVNQVEMGVLSSENRRNSRNILNASSSGSLDQLGWPGPNNNVSSFGINSSTDYNNDSLQPPNNNSVNIKTSVDSSASSDVDSRHI
ncbi:hypothetical protein SAMD00019534_102460 [Acytostelium subglobosum LB1]|uniref:hypothetical protein n=1 Tax=Acytostelium subglobosum LB1 TaxID=1410327 RepID=UPI000644CB5E|nr:hypothetical protein SAMD00019534_102460 [Acytostelium subglobosum LB1]GAM27071.1 hypothetical protein SAMD00019534_102460 [Acytostelium subglobosum LB1]|eukprot:XP_012749951.1 hypothetical protein SAMD00019534_102460 [Acytostelium subglobosum LB1]